MSLRQTRIALGFALLLVVGCARPDQASLFQPDWPTRLDRVDGAMPPAPDDLPPLRADHAPWPDTDDAISDGVLTLSIEQAAMLGLGRNRDLQVQRLGPVIAGTFEQIERGAFDPEVFGGLTYEESAASETNRATGQRFDAESQEVAGRLGLRQRTPLGGAIELEVSQSNNTSNRSPEQQQARVGVTLTQSLLRGAGPAVNLARIRQARLDGLASVYELRAYAENLLAQIETAYWRFILAREQITIVERALEVSAQQLRDVEARIEVGVLSTSEAAVARAEISRRRIALIEARSAMTERRLRLLRLISAGGADALALDIQATTSPATPIHVDEDIEDRIRLAWSMRPELQEARLRVEQRRLETVVSRNGLLPRLDVFVTLGKSGFADTFTESFRDMDGESFDLAAGVSLRQALGARTARGEQRATGASRHQAAAAVDNLTQLVALDVRLAANELDRARQQIAATAEARRLEQLAADAEMERFDAGASTSLLIAQAQRDLLSAQVAEVEALIAYRVARVGLYLAEGSLLERRGVTVGDPQPAPAW